MSFLQIYEPGQTPEPHSQDAAVGIDLGTTNSVIAIAGGGSVTVLHDVCGGVLVPSVVHYGENGVSVGKSALAMMQEGKPVISSIKRLMGRSAGEARMIAFPYLLAEHDQGALRFRFAERWLTPVEVSAEILRHMKSLAEKATGQEVRSAVITVPAYFDDAARQATKDAARLAGLEVLRLINEPTAAALAYGLDKGAEGIYAVYDLGGGTFDISILKLEKGVFQVLATGGDVMIGGDDFDRLLAQAALTKMHAPEADAPSQSCIAHARVVKENLSAVQEAVFSWNGRQAVITRAEFEEMIEPLVRRTLEICAQALEDAGLDAGQLQGIVLVGGSTRIPYLRERIRGELGHMPLSDINPDEVVAVGAAIQAEALTHGSDNLLLDVVPLSLGLETMGGITEKLIYRNTPIPVSVAQDFTTYQDGQTGMVIHVVQGEREMVGDNRSLARFELAGIPNLPAGIARVKVTFAVDADGLLNVSAAEENTGVEQSVSVKPSYGLSEEEIGRMLLESMEFARQDITARLLREAEMESRRSMEEVKSALAQDGHLVDAEEAVRIGAQMEALEQAIASGDRDAIDFERGKLHDVTRPFAERRMDSAIGAALKGKNIA